MLERRFRRDLASLDEIFQFVASYLKSRGLDPGHSTDVGLLIEEVFTNMLKYAKGGGREVAIGLGGSGSDVVITIRDFDVESFDITAAPEADIDRPLAERKAGGLGLHLVRRLADSIGYEYKDRSAIVTLTKRLVP
ncbi:MAG: ATP-binding protein [Candidatus Latescibacteria bacterium]|nr:ATP-binding protein [Candidatus Latescibacterota bacterium]